MRFKNFDLNLLVVFDTIYHEGNLTRTSEALSITQPAVSNALMRLRKSFDDQLFVRTGKTMTPTPMAQNMIVPIRQVLRQLNSVISDPQSFDPSTSERTFNISISDVRASFLLPKLIPLLTKTAPHVRLRCFRVDRNDIETELASGRLDLAVDVPQFVPQSMEKLFLPEEEYVCALRRGHPLEHQTLNLDDYLSLEHITVSGRRRGGGYVESALSSMGKRIVSPLRLQNYPPAFQVLMQSDLALSAPGMLATQYDVAIKPLPFELAPVRSCAFWHRASDDDAGCAWLRALLASVSPGTPD